MANDQNRPPQDPWRKAPPKYIHTDRDKPRAGIMGKVMIFAMGALVGGVAGGALTIYMIARAIKNAQAGTANTLLGGGAIIGALVGLVIVFFILRDEASGR
ncbi:hypothetical protein IT570_02055 [Candidatus Sumerlaeota bacterium]|nr:hypothetical protein [Candidatus Sumerlaeota bacterium]